MFDVYIEGDCLATGKIQASGEMSLLMMISYEYKDKNLDLTVAGANAGVFTTPIVLGSPYVCCIDISDEEKEGHMFFNSSLLSYKLEGHLQKVLIPSALFVIFLEILMEHNLVPLQIILFFMLKLFAMVLQPRTLLYE